MKHLSMVILTICLVLLAPKVMALNLAVDQDLMDFTLQNELDENEISDLNNPFLNQLQPLVEDEQQVDQLLVEQNNNFNPEAAAEELEVKGILVTGGEKIILIKDLINNTSELLRPGEMIAGYTLLSYRDSQVFLTKNGNEFTINY
ncbi:hypothetical protein [Halanaerobium salsuginis]|jgi:uncharacterized Zn ribbon protein|uniref:Uncharacterized protein n=1 Tax=Halanaerobium salsuginis TaxID=29563 RepID=A0A1I4ES75_9FIRM|nr:hypothetical protein [Halanaerobium salsuginis]SFL08554.1 hypothetical protein SAMN02983006_00124 [Halanaerobium salsuginis]